jgi:SPP1 gp7 family putative phage head morphogenesis protein
MPEVLPFDLPFQEAIDYFKAKGIEISPDSWRDVWQAANARSFTVARVTSADVLGDIKAAVQKAADEGMSLGDFKKSLRPTLEARGWLAPEGEKAITIGPDGEHIKRLNGWRLDTIYQTNLQAAYSVGRYQQMTETAQTRPYWQYMAIMDSRTRYEHAAMNGKVYDYRHPFWNEWYPPNGFNCRCYVKALSGEDLAERNLSAETKGVNVHPDDGWNYNVGEAGLATGWDPNGGLPDCVFAEFAAGAGGCITIVPGQRNWKDQGRPDLRAVSDELRIQAPSLLPAGATPEEAIEILMQALGMTAGANKVIASPIEEIILRPELLAHMVAKRSDARERYANFILPTLTSPFEIYLTEYDDGWRERYIGLFQGPNDLMVMVRLDKDGGLFWNFMQARDKKMNTHRIGQLLWPK